MSGSLKRITPLPRLLSLAGSLMPSGAHPLAQSLSGLLRRDDITCVDVVSYRTDFEALRELGVLHPRENTRILLVPPSGITQSDVKKLLDRQVAGQEFRQVDLSRVAELVHLKLIIMRKADGRQFAVTGSANYTKAGTGNNCEFSVLFELQPDYKSAVTALFDDLWERGSQEVKPDDYASVTSEEREHNERLILLPFQDEALEKLKQSYDAQNGRGGALLSLPTGAGKTVIAVKFLLDRVLSEPGDRVLWLAPHEELLFQAASTFKKMRPFFRCQGLVVPDENQVVGNTQGENPNVAFRTIQGAHRNGSGVNPKVVMIDEAHWGAAFSRKMLPELRKRYRDSFFLGLTGTPFRKELAELSDLHHLYGGLIYRERSEVENETDARGCRVLAIVQSKTKDTGYKIDLDELTLEAAELNDQALRKFNGKIRNQIIAKYWQSAYGKTLVFAVSIDHANALAIAFGEEWPDVPIQVVHSGEIPRRVPSRVSPSNGGSLTAHDRQTIHQQFRRGDIQILIAVNIYTMGVDFPAVETLFMARPTLSPVVYSQMLGRGLRGPAFGGTEFVRVIDFVDQVSSHQHLCNRIMQFQLERNWVGVRDKEIAGMKKLSAQCRTCRPAESRQQLMGKAGIYRVTMPSGKQRDYRDWHPVADIGKAVSNGLQNKTVRPYDTVTYVLENDVKRRGEILSKLRLAKPDSDACGF